MNASARGGVIRVGDSGAVSVLSASALCSAVLSASVSGRSANDFSPNTRRNFSVVPSRTGRPGASSRPTGSRSPLSSREETA